MSPGDLVELRLQSALSGVDLDDTVMCEPGDIVVLLQLDVISMMHLILHPVHGIRHVYYKSLIPAVQR